MATTLEAAPILSTPDNLILESTTTPPTVHPPDEPLSDEELRITYDIERTLKEIREGRWQRVALQFPDEMLPDAPRVFQLLSRGLAAEERGSSSRRLDKEKRETAGLALDGNQEGDGKDLADSFSDGLKLEETTASVPPKLYILADTSYGTCCVDEVAAEHVNADVVVHYGRACLSPTARLPVIHVFTQEPLDHSAVIAAFKESYPDHKEKVVVAADVTYSNHVDPIVSKLQEEGYADIFATSVVHEPSSPIPNRTVPSSVREDPESLKEWQLFHVSDPPTALLLTLSSRVGSIRIYPTDQGSAPKPVVASTFAALRRRYATLTSLSTVPVFGILINTLSVKNYLHIVEHVQKQIAGAGKKSYMFVVGKLNAAKVANFSEIGGWVVIGCWESSLVDSKDFWKPLITPYELELALQSDAERVWTGEWSSDFQPLLEKAKAAVQKEELSSSTHATDGEGSEATAQPPDDDEFSEPESAPPEFDLRTGRYVTSSRPMRPMNSNSSAQTSSSRALAKRINGDVAMIAGVVSPGAEFLRTQRTWGGLGSDFTIEYEENGSAAGERGSAVVEGRRGIARGYTVGEDSGRH